MVPRLLITSCLRLFVAPLLLTIFLSQGTVFAQEKNYDPTKFSRQRFIEYERQLNAILKTRRDEEKLFVALVVAQVRAGKIPSKLVQTSFQWVRNKRPHTNYPFIYFEKVLRLQAAKLNIAQEIPPFDFSIYLPPGSLPHRRSLSVGQNRNFHQFGSAASRRR